MSNRIALTGATGHIGGIAADILHARGVPARLLVRDLSRAPSWADDVAVAPYGDQEACRAALAGIDILLMVSAHEAEDRLEQHLALIGAARDAGVGHVVYTSFLSAAPDAVFTYARTHWSTERALAASGMGWTFLQDSFYADDFPEFAVDGVIAGPAGDGRVGAVARADVGRCAGAVLLDLAGAGQRPASAHDSATYRLTGPAALSLAEIAQALTEHGSPTVYRAETIEEAYASREAYGAPDWELDGWVSTYASIASGALDVVTDDVRALTGREPMSFADLLATRG
ncbi:SDR family oxidoreductase [Actinomyces marmotae]|uniref:SDR family oxidoreductase n=1 Tax=Actinomyces marmotae TaxID=2737173 RepID=A0A6M8B8P1_9ACTO|nr:SDR family oxidoreductase [Actinomyces marmotae]QKD79761.1 SDR family oxidoreductase [Actinomyces marmotae]